MVPEPPPVFVIGDIHGQTDTAVDALKRAGILDSAGLWSAGPAALWFLGDLVDRGDQGLEAIDLVMRLQAEARLAGGRVQCLAGNHDLLFLGVRRFAPGPGASELLDTWLMNGGRAEEVRDLSDEQAAWMASLPLVGMEGDALLVHCDASFYKDLGASVDVVNERFAGLLQAGSVGEWWDFTVRLFGRFELDDARREGAAALSSLLAHFGAARVVHGHTPIPAAARVDPSSVTRPLVYSGGRCINCDGGMYLGGPGFVYRLDGTQRDEGSTIEP
ncbi:MAG: metallophosphoesterase [Actinomycetota bacterium]